MMSALSNRSFRGWFATLLLFVCTGLAAQQANDAVHVADAWTRAMPPGISSAAIYFDVTTRTDDELLRISSAIASDAQIHEVTQTNGMMQMRPRSSVQFKAGVPVKFTPQAMHVMLTGVKQSLKVGDHFTLSLTFRHAGMVNIDVRVRSVDWLQ
jgi:copper(I)-binding protein